MIVFDKCCFCIPLKSGCFILAYFQLVGQTINGVFSLMGISASMAILNSENADEIEKHIAHGLLVFFALSLLMVLIAFPFTALLLVGLNKEKRDYIKYYLIGATFFVVLSIIAECAKFIGGYMKPFDVPGVVASIVLNIYFLLVIRSQYIKMSSNAPTSNNPSSPPYRPGWGPSKNLQKV